MMEMMEVVYMMETKEMVEKMEMMKMSFKYLKL